MVNGHNLCSRLVLFLDGNNTVNLQGLDDSTKKAIYWAFVTSMYLSILNPLFDYVRASLIGLNMAAYATIIAYTGLLNITDDIKKFIIEHQTCNGGDIIDGILFYMEFKRA